MNNLIGVSGKMGSGKNLVGDIVVYLDWINSVNSSDMPLFTDSTEYGGEVFSLSHLHNYRQLAFADKLKDIVCLMIGCTRADLEDREFKEKPLGREWDCMETTSSYGGPAEIRPMGSMEWTHSDRRRTTPRLLLQLMGTECGRQTLHPNIWINALFADYGIESELVDGKPEVIYQSWIITDVRFPDEVKAIEDRGGIVIRLQRPNDQTGLTNVHESETALDNHAFEHVIQNDGSIEELVEKVKEILDGE